MKEVMICSAGPSLRILNFEMDFFLQRTADRRQNDDTKARLVCASELAVKKSMRAYDLSQLY